jgi:hypothetical protein
MKRRWMELSAIAAALGAAAIAGACNSDLPTAIPATPHPGGGDGGSGQGGEGSGSGGVMLPPDASAQDLFTQSVYGTLMDTCGNCHVDGIGTPYFLAADATTAYGLVKALPGYVTDPSNSRLILKPVHSGGAAPALTDQQKTVVTAWLDKELEETPIDPEDPVGLTPLQQLEKFASCMSFDDWEAANVANLSNERVIFQNNPVECDSCHDDGQDGTCISAESALMFEKTKMMPFILKLAAVTLNEDGTFSDIVRSNRWIEKCVEDLAVGNPHPPCENDQISAEVVTAIDSFFDATYARWEADECELATEPPPPAP